MPRWREKYWGLQELPCLLNKHSMMLLLSRLCCLSLPCLYICCKEKIGWTYMGGIRSSLSTELLRRKATEGRNWRIFKQFPSKQILLTICFSVFWAEQDDCHVLFAVMARKILRSARIARLVVKAFHHAVTSVELVLFLYSVKFAISRVNCFVKVHRPTVSIE